MGKAHQKLNNNDSKSEIYLRPPKAIIFITLLYPMTNKDTPIIQAKNLQKTFKVEVKQSGFLQRMKSLFHPTYKEIKAVDGINFEIKR